MQPTIFIAAAMRSGSTHIKNSLSRLGWKPISSHVCLEGHYNEEHMVDARIATVLFPLGGFVVQQHSRAIGRNVPLLREYDVPVVVTYRNLPDSLLSWKESTRIDTERGLRGSYTFAPILIPNWDGWDEERVESWVVNNVAPWYISFYVSWRVAEIKTHFVKYSDYYADQPKGLEGILRFCGADVPTPQILEAVTAPRGGKFNVGKVGRGAKLLLPSTLRRIEEQIDCWGHWAPELRKELL